MACLVYAAWLLIVGVEWYGVTEIQPGGGEQRAYVEYVRAPEGIIPLVAALGLAVGVAGDNPTVMWSGWVALTLFGVFFVFSSGGPLLPSALVLAVPLTALSIMRYRLRPRP